MSFFEKQDNGVQLIYTPVKWKMFPNAVWNQNYTRYEIVAYRQTYNISHTLIGNNIFDHADVIRASPVCAAPASSFST